MSERITELSTEELLKLESEGKIYVSWRDDYMESKEIPVKSSALVTEYYSRMKNVIYGDELYVLKTYCEFYESLREFQKEIHLLKDYIRKKSKSFNPFTRKKIRECREMVDRLENQCVEIKNHLGKIEDTKELKAFLLKESKTEYVVMEFSSKTRIFPTPQPVNKIKSDIIEKINTTHEKQSTDKSDELNSIINKYYLKFVDILSNLNVNTDVKSELIPVIFVVFDMALVDKKGCNLTEKETSEFVEKYISWVEELPNSDDKLKFFDKRLKLYKRIICDEIPLRCEWLMWQKPKESDAMTKCVVAFGDILFNPECAENYENAPVVIADIFDIPKFADNMMKVRKIMTDLFQEIAIVFGIQKEEEKEFVSAVNLSDAEWEHLYKTDFEKFWEMVVEEYDLSKLPDRIMSLRDDTMIYGEDARKMYLSRLKGVVGYNEWTTKNRPEVINIHWNTLKELKKELQEKTSEKVYMLDVIKNYEDKYIRY